MDTLLIRERYKVVQVLETRENYAFAEAVDILDREKSSYLLNIYEGPLLRTYLPCFDQLDACPDFQGVFLEGESLVAVFRYRAGTPIDQVFYRGDRHDWRSRLEYAQQLLHQVLNMADLPAQVSCAALLSENVLVNENSRDVSLRFQVPPMEEMTGGSWSIWPVTSSTRSCCPASPHLGRSWSCWTSWRTGRAPRWSSSTPCGGSGSRSSGRLTRPWRKRISSGAGAPWSGGTGSGGSPGGGGGETYGQIEKNRCFSGASGHFGRRRGSAVLGPGGGVPLHPDLRGGGRGITSSPPPTRRGRSTPWAAPRRAISW